MLPKAIQTNKVYSNIRHNTIPVFFHCPKCLVDSNTPGRKKTFKNLSSLDSHFSTDHKGESWVELAKIMIRQFAMRLENE